MIMVDSKNNIQQGVAQSHNAAYHRTVLMQEVVEYLNPQPGKVYVDATFGGGGHTRAILLHEPQCKVVAVDWDIQAIEKNMPALQEEFGDRLDYIWGNFAQLPHLLKKFDKGMVDGVLVDFGTSQYQITEREGFSFSADTPLDMRMSPAHYKTTAADIINTATEKELVYIFQEFGEERHSRTIARAICEARHHRKIKTTQDLVKIILDAIPARLEKKRGIHPATRVFQALRIVVNKELENIKTFLLHLPEILNPGARVVCISFHSLEDRLVKTYFKEHADEFTLLTKKVVTPTEEEIRWNPSSRSSRLRAAEKL